MDSFALVLFVVVDLLGILGACLVATPFLREFGLKRTLDLLRRPEPLSGLQRAEQAALKATEAELAKFKPEDGAFVICGLIVIALSYALHIAAEVIDHAAR